MNRRIKKTAGAMGFGFSSTTYQAKQWSNSRVPVTCPPGFQGRYTVQPGDTMFFIAQRFGVSLQALISANPQISNPNLIFPGDVLCVPGVAPPVDCRVPVTCPPGFQGRYTVQPGDTMFFIAQRFGVSLQALISANPQIPNPNLIFPCDVLCVPGVAPPVDCRVPVTCPPGFQGRYTVQPGDTMFLIAQRFGVSLQALISANPQISNPNLIFPCDVLCVPGVAPPVDCRVPVTCPPGFQGRYTVQPGDTMFLIAQRFGVSLQALISANPQISNPNLIFPCDVLCVPGPPPPPAGRVPKTCPPGFRGRYTVQAGDTMFTIAQQCCISLQALINANPHITDPSQIFHCDVLCVPCPHPGRVPVKCPRGFRAQYTVHPGDSMFSIAQMFGVSLQALISANPQITDPSQIFPCDVLCVPCVPVRVSPCFHVDLPCSDEEPDTLLQEYSDEPEEQDTV